MEPNTNEATAPKRLKTGGKKPIIIIGVIVAGTCLPPMWACAPMPIPWIPFTPTPPSMVWTWQASQRSRPRSGCGRRFRRKPWSFIYRWPMRPGMGRSAPEGDVAVRRRPLTPYAPIGSWASQRNWTMRSVPNPHLMPCQGRSSFLVKGWEYLACLVGADGQLGVVLEPEEDIFQVKMEQLSEQFSREAHGRLLRGDGGCRRNHKSPERTVRVRRRSCADCTGKMDWQPAMARRPACL